MNFFFKPNKTKPDCTKCGGNGYYFEHYDRDDPRGPSTRELEDEGKKFKCNSCNGTGKRKQ